MKITYEDAVKLKYEYIKFSESMGIPPQSEHLKTYDDYIYNRIKDEIMEKMGTTYSKMNNKSRIQYLINESKKLKNINIK